MKKLLRVFLVVLWVLFFGYVLPRGPEFPRPLPDALQSQEPADTETPLRRAYFTNATSEEVMGHYQNLFKGYRLNYPPEEAKTLIRDQTRSTFLEEIVHPLRESLYINGFEPKDPKDAIEIEGKPWRQKIIVRYVPSNTLTRVLVVVLSGALVALFLKLWPNRKS